MNAIPNLCHDAPGPEAGDLLWTLGALVLSAPATPLSAAPRDGLSWRITAYWNMGALTQLHRAQPYLSPSSRNNLPIIDQDISLGNSTKCLHLVSTASKRYGLPGKQTAAPHPLPGRLSDWRISAFASICREADRAAGGCVSHTRCAGRGGRRARRPGDEGLVCPAHGGYVEDAETSGRVRLDNRARRNKVSGRTPPPDLLRQKARTREGDAESSTQRHTRTGERGGGHRVLTADPSDIAWGYSADSVLKSLEDVWDIPLSRGSKVLALTIPEIKSRDEDLDDRRNAVNDGIKTRRKRNL